MRGNYVRFLIALLCATCAAAMLSGTARAQGIYFPAVGAVNQSMGGASTAAPTDALGAMLWNPAAISGLKESEVDISSAFLIPNIYVSSTLPGGASGTTRSDSGLGAVANTALVLRLCDAPRLTMGMASYYAGAGGSNFPGDPTNPVLSFGPIYANLIVFQTTGQVSLQVTDKLSIGAGPVVDTIVAAFDPAFFAPKTGIGPLSFPSATDGRPYWGGGFKVGAYYHLLPSVDVGFGYTSPQWIENLTWYSRDALGNPITVTLPMQLPAIYSAGIGIKPTDQLLLAVDCRLIDNVNSSPFGLPPAAAGLGWQDVFVAAVGAQYQFGPRLSARVGYSYNTPTFPSNLTLFNVQAPAVTQHVVSAGFTAHIADNVFASLAYAYTVQNTVSGSAFQLGGSQSLSANIHSIFLTMTVKFGTPSRHGQTAPTDTLPMDSNSTTANAGPITLPTATPVGTYGAPIQ
ncbi:MAG TPA: outer membrane protein transport protein [Gemmataceae bacterium]|nr:outer membrane protein transport protein [Gemmataceae bacterium]